MSAQGPLRVAVTVNDPVAASWQRQVVEAVRSEPVNIVDANASRTSDVPDVVIDLADGRPLVEPRFGVWRYGFGDGAPAADGAPGILARVYRLAADRTHAAVLREGWFRRASDEAPGHDVGAHVAPWCALLLRQLAMDSSALDGAPVVPMAGCECPLPPTGAGLLTSVRSAVSLWRRRERWTIGFAATTVDDILARGEMDEPRWLHDIDADRYLADPFPVAVDRDRVRLLAEEFQYRQGRGRIVSVEALRDGRVRDTRVVIDAPYHLAYPFVWRAGDTAYCVPEGAATGRAEAFSLDSSGQRCTLLGDFPAVDPTIVAHAGRLWLFCTRGGPENQSDLYVFEAEAWGRPWRPHSLNPVKTDVRSSRPAGALFTRKGALFRPSQDCSRRYGGAVAINRILELSTKAFREETVCRLKPAPSWRWPDGLHTLNAIDDLVVVDALRVER